jgi:hypothetical protein
MTKKALRADRRSARTAPAKDADARRAAQAKRESHSVLIESSMYVFSAVSTATVATDDGDSRALWESPGALLI